MPTSESSQGAGSTDEDEMAKKARFSASKSANDLTGDTYISTVRQEADNMQDDARAICASLSRAEAARLVAAVEEFREYERKLAGDKADSNFPEQRAIVHQLGVSGVVDLLQRGLEAADTISAIRQRGVLTKDEFEAIKPVNAQDLEGGVYLDCGPVDGDPAMIAYYLGSSCARQPKGHAKLTGIARRVIGEHGDPVYRAKFPSHHYTVGYLTGTPHTYTVLWRLGDNQLDEICLKVATASGHELGRTRIASVTLLETYLIILLGTYTGQPDELNRLLRRRNVLSNPLTKAANRSLPLGSVGPMFKALITVDPELDDAALKRFEEECLEGKHGPNAKRDARSKAAWRDGTKRLTLKRRGMTEGLCVTLATTQGLKDWMESACQSIEG